MSGLAIDIELACIISVVILSAPGAVFEVRDDIYDFLWVGVLCMKGYSRNDFVLDE